MSFRHGRALLIALCIATAWLLHPGLAHAGTWTLVSCQQPNGSPASTDGWSAGQFQSGSPGTGSADSNRCSQNGGALSAVTNGGGTDGTGVQWIFTAPAGESIVGGAMNATLNTPNFGEDWLSTPTDDNNGADTFAYCASNSPLSADCGQGGNPDTTATAAIHESGGANLYGVARCYTECASVNGLAAELDIHWAQIALSVSATPTGANFSGPLLSAPASGTAGLLFTAADPQNAGAGGSYGPGVYAVNVLIDGTSVYNANPNPNPGTCTSLGSSTAGGQMFTGFQPCPTSEAIDVPVDTTKLTDGNHELKVMVSDAAGNTATVLDQTITTKNSSASPTSVTPTPAKTSPTKRSKAKDLHVRITSTWTWRIDRSRVHRMTFVKLPAHSTVTVACSGRACAHNLGRTGPHLKLATLLKRLERDTFYPGQKLLVTVARSGYRAQRVEYTMRLGRSPAAKLLAYR